MLIKNINLKHSKEEKMAPYNFRTNDTKILEIKEKSRMKFIKKPINEHSHKGLH